MAFLGSPCARADSASESMLEAFGDRARPELGFCCPAIVDRKHKNRTAAVTRIPRHNFASTLTGTQFSKFPYSSQPRSGLREAIPTNSRELGRASTNSRQV